MVSMQGNREKIEKEVEKNPGLGFSELKERTGLSNGVLQYHIQASDSLKKAKGAILLKDTCEGCSLGEYCGEKCIRKVLSKPLNMEIVKYVIEGLNQTSIAEKTGLSRSTICYHVNKLKDYNVVERHSVPEEIKDFVEQKSD